MNLPYKRTIIIYTMIGLEVNIFIIQNVLILGVATIELNTIQI